MDLSQKLHRYADLFGQTHTQLYANRIPDDQAACWMENNIPLFECDDKTVEQTYYFRYWTYRKHIKDTPEGTVVTEFLPDVPWSGPYNTISCPLGHHVAEGRWLRDKSVIQDDIRFFLNPGHTEHAIHYASAFLWQVYLYCRHSGDRAFACEIAPNVIAQYEAWERKSGTPWGLFYSDDGYDGMECSIGGSGLRPTLNTYLYGALLACAWFCKLTGDERGAEFLKKAEVLKKNINEVIWDRAASFYKTVPMTDIASKPDFERANPNRNVREEVGFIPFSVPGLCDGEQEQAFALLTDPAVFAAPYGITTADMSHPLFMKNPIHHECLWDGPVWPYATAQTLTALYTLLTEKDSKYIGDGDYMRLLHQYAYSQRRYEDGVMLDWIDENLDPFTGQWIARDLIYLDHAYDFPKERGADYNHSTFCDLVLSGACGILADTDFATGRRTLRVKPLCNGAWRYFAVQNCPIGGELFDLYYDADLNRYGFGHKLTLLRNGIEVAADDAALTYEY